MLSILRIVAALLFMEHGTQKLFGFPSDQPESRLSLTSLLGVAGILEFFGGLLMVAGLFTRPVALILSIQMAVAYFMAHAPRGPWPILNQGELAILYGSVFLLLVAAGGGPWSLDRLLQRNTGEASISRPFVL
jgi:putative oxidoreductase